jgi:hypothetical protein
MACQRQVVRIIRAAVLLRYDMFDMMDQLAILLVKPAVFATFGSPPPDEVPRHSIHLLLNLRVQLPPRFELEDRDEIRCVDQGFIFQAFVIRKGAFVSPLSERIDSFLNWCGDLQLDYPARGFHVKTATQRLQEAIQAGCSTHVPTLTWNVI